MANTTVWSAGHRLVGVALERTQPTMAWAIADSVANNLATLTPAIGLALPLERKGVYRIDGYLAYQSGTTPGIKFALNGPERWTVQFGLIGIAVAAAGSTGNGVSDRQSDTAFGVNAGIALAGSGSAMFAAVRGYVSTNNDSGVASIEFAQSTANASDTFVRAGSWLRAFFMTTN